MPKEQAKITPAERKLKNILAQMIGELYYPQYQSTTYDGADIPTQETVDRYLPKIRKAFGAIVMEKEI